VANSDQDELSGVDDNTASGAAADKDALSIAGEDIADNTGQPSTRPSTTATVTAYPATSYVYRYWGGNEYYVRRDYDCDCDSAFGYDSDNEVHHFGIDCNYKD